MNKVGRGGTTGRRPGGSEEMKTPGGEVQVEEEEEMKQ